MRLISRLALQPTLRNPETQSGEREPENKYHLHEAHEGYDERTEKSFKKKERVNPRIQ